MRGDWTEKGLPAHMMPPDKPTEARSERPLDADEVEVCEAILAGEVPRVAFRRLTGHVSEPSFQRFLNHPDALVYMAMRRAEMRETVMDGDDPAREWLEMVRHLAYYDPAEIVTEQINKPADILKLPTHVRKLLNGWKWDKAGNFILTFVDRRVALDMLGKYWGLYQQDRKNDRDTERELLTKAFWRYVMVLHLRKGMSVAEAMVEARRHPEKLEEFARQNGLLMAGRNEIEVG